MIVSGANADLALTCNSYYKIPIDIRNKTAVSIHYYVPNTFTLESDYSWSWIDFYGYEYIIESDKSWGDDTDYNEIITNFELFKNFFLDKGIPVIISEVVVITEEEKKIESIREFLYVVFSISFNYNGILACLWIPRIKPSEI